MSALNMSALNMSALKSTGVQNAESIQAPSVESPGEAIADSRAGLKSGAPPRAPRKTGRLRTRKRKSTETFARVLITGASGQLARALALAAPPDTQCMGVSRADCDISDAASVARAIESARPDLVFNGAAYNLVDKAESEGAEEALRVNALGVARLAEACARIKIPLVHFSTDFVFDGQQRTPYQEDDIPNPLGVYGASKLAGENVALTESERNFAIRVSRLYGPTEIDGAGSSKKPSGNFPLLMLRLAQERDSVRVVNDQIGSPSYTPDLARAIWDLVRSSDGGLYHLSNEGEVAFDEYAREIFRLSGARCEVESISTAEYGAPAQRPLYSTLGNRRAQAAGVAPLRHWQEALAEFISTLPPS